MATTTTGLEGTTFELADGAVRRRLIMSIEGDWGTGKTDLALTAPGPIAFFRMDLNTEVTVAKYAKKKRIYQSNINIPRSTEPNAQKLAETAWDTFVRDYERAIASREIRTVVWDTATQIWELCRLAAFGKLTNVMPHHYVAVNNSFRDLIKRAYDSDTNLIMVHRLKAEWLNVPDGKGGEKGKKTGNMERAGFSDIGFATQMMLQTLFDQDDEKGSPFRVKVLKCTQQPMLTGKLYGLEGGMRMNQFAVLAHDVFPDSDLNDWGFEL